MACQSYLLFEPVAQRYPSPALPCPYSVQLRTFPHGPTIQPNVSHKSQGISPAKPKIPGGALDCKNGPKVALHAARLETKIATQVEIIAVFIAVLAVIGVASHGNSSLLFPLNHSSKGPGTFTSSYGRTLLELDPACDSVPCSCACALASFSFSYFSL